MSRIGNRVIMIPEGVTVENKDGIITVTGPKGTLTKELPEGINFENKDNQITLTRTDDKYRAMHGTINSLINNMVVGVKDGYEKVNYTTLYPEFFDCLKEDNPILKRFYIPFKVN